MAQMKTLNGYEIVDQTARNSVANLKNEILKSIYSVGDIIVTLNSTNPSNRFGGTWERFGQGRTLIGVGSGTDINNTTMNFADSSTGGKYETRIYEQNLSGNVTVSRQSNGFGSHAEWKNFNANGNWAVDAIRDTGTPFQQPISIIQPYITVYFWKKQNKY